MSNWAAHVKKSLALLICLCSCSVGDGDDVSPPYTSRKQCLPTRQGANQLLMAPVSWLCQIGQTGYVKLMQGKV